MPGEDGVGRKVDKEKAIKGYASVDKVKVCEWPMGLGWVGLKAN